MKRRNFIQTGLATSSAMLATAASSMPFEGVLNSSGRSFQLNYAPHEGMFANHAPGGILEQLRFMADQGFAAFEDNGMRGRSTDEQSAMAKVMTERGIDMGVFVAHTIYWDKPSLTTGKKEFIDQFLAECSASVEVAKRVNAKWMTVVPGNFDRSIPIGIQTGNIIEVLRRAADIFAKHDLVMVLEALSDTPDLFLRHSDQTYMICKAVNSPACKILFDMYHMQKNEGRMMYHIDQCWDEIAYFQIGDEPARNEPTTGEINYGNLFKHIHQKGFKGILGMEHGNATAGKAGEQAVIAAYRICDSF